ncbi:DUF4129 domain-containing protein [Nocardioides glacieisoli]|uniref:DUF4129 domain-containing protein n=1 Tax=Nocardioides glacieisoli TaxID=1168730 RepID=A0A4Q2RUP8_9ACTN|nr:DUF4129 domain-containing protein [Nocardioides glacieisoli]RYB91539.1 DUF4129 domain-containing protein [Nocardioides glacieisoli]
MRALRDVSPPVRAVVTVAATSLFMVLVAWATLIGPDEVFTGPGPRPAQDVTTPTSCIPLPEETAPDGIITYGVPDDINERDYCDPPGASIDDYRDLAEQNPPPWWVKVLVYVILFGLLGLVAGGVLWLLVTVVRAALSRRGGEERVDVALTVLDEPDRVAAAVVADAEEQDALLRDGDARNAIVAAWHRFEVQGEAAGVPRHGAETSSEYALRFLDLADADTGPVRRLAELYREARFSEHEITEQHRAEALDTLAAIRRSLGVRA